MEHGIEISNEADAKLSIEAGKLAIEVGYEGKIGGGIAKVYVKTDALVDLICAKIPGTLDDQLGALLKAGLNTL